MRSRVVSLLGLLMAAVLALGSLPGTAMATSRQLDNASYQSPQYGYQVEWSDDWAPRERDTSSIRGGADTLMLSTNAGRLQIIGQPNDIDVAILLLEIIERLSADASEVTITTNDPTLTVPTSAITVGNTSYRIEIHDLDDTLVSVILSARLANAESALALAQDGVTLNGTPLFLGERAHPGDDVPTDTGDIPGSGLDGTTFTSPTYGFTATWDEDWEAEEFLEGAYEFIVLTSSTGTTSIVGTATYTGDAAACLEGESTIFATEQPNIVDWEPAVDRRGNEIGTASETFAYGIFTLGYGSDDGYVEVVDYLECRTLVPGESTMIVLISATRDQFPDHLDASLEITNAIEMPAGSELAVPADPVLPDLSQQPASTEEPLEPTGTPVATGESGLDGATFTSPGFDFSLTVPDGWLVISETIAAGDERLQVTNGTSLITIRATDAIFDDATACVGAMEAEAKSDPLYASLRLATTDRGEMFQGADDRGAYALFTYTGDDGSEWAYFVRCEPLVEGESMLIIVQDVPYEDYATERQARRIIQNAIERP